MPPRYAASPEAGGLERYVIPNLRNACRVLKRMALHGRPMRASEIARSLGIPATTVLRIMATLQLEGLVAKQAGMYDLGPALLSLGGASAAGSGIREAAIPELEHLTRATGETSHVAVPSGGRSLILAVCDSPHPLRAASRPGYLADLHCSSTGKVFLAFGGTKQAQRIPARLTRRTGRTLVSNRALRSDLEAVRRRGYALDDEEYHEGVRCIAAPVRGVDGSIVAAVGVTAAAVRLTREREPDAAREVRAAADRLSAALGFQGAA